MKILKWQDSKSWVRAANVEGNATLRRGAGAEYVASPYFHIGGLTLKQVHGGGLLRCNQNLLTVCFEGG